jgi:hypothetical protein
VGTGRRRLRPAARHYRGLVGHSQHSRLWPGYRIAPGPAPLSFAQHGILGRPTRVPGNYPHADRLRWRDDIHLAYRQRPWLSLSFQSLVIRTAQIPSASDFSRAPSGSVSVGAGNLGAEFWPRRFPRLTELRPNPPVQSTPRRALRRSRRTAGAMAGFAVPLRSDPLLLRARLQAGGSHEAGGGTILSRPRRGGAPG